MKYLLEKVLRGFAKRIAGIFILAVFDCCRSTGLPLCFDPKIKGTIVNQQEETKTAAPYQEETIVESRGGPTAELGDKSLSGNLILVYACPPGQAADASSPIAEGLLTRFMGQKNQVSAQFMLPDCLIGFKVNESEITLSCSSKLLL